MPLKYTKRFGELSRKYIVQKSKYKKNYDSSINILFDKVETKLTKIQANRTESEYRLAELRNLVTQLQTKRLRNKIKASNDFFIL